MLISNFSGQTLHRVDKLEQFLIDETFSGSRDRNDRFRSRNKNGKLKIDEKRKIEKKKKKFARRRNGRGRRQASPRFDRIVSCCKLGKSKEMRSEQRWECNWLGNLRKTPSFLAMLPLLGSLTMHKSFVEKFPRERIRGTSGEVSSWFSSVTILR